MKVAIAGAGIAGAYLARILGELGIFPDVYDDDQSHETTCGYRSCGWGAPLGIGKYLGSIGLDMGDYLLESMSHMNFDGLTARTPLCTIHKPRLIRDLRTGIRLQKTRLGLEDAGAYDIVVDATGISRILLPPCRSDLTLPTLQYRVKAEADDDDRLEAGVHGNRIPALGYVWIFPLGKGQYHIGIGCLGLSRMEELLQEFYQELSEKHPLTSLCSCRGMVRVASPFYATPHSISRERDDGRTQIVVGVGESIGTVSPFTGEGIVYSLECARMLADSWPDFEGYSRRVLSRFSWMKKERETIDFLLSREGKGQPRIRDRWRFYRNAHRSGIRLPVLEAFRRMGSLSMWVEGGAQE
jgi:flavin-dependent dehydrogenase